MSLYRLAGLLLGIIWNNPVQFGRSIYVFFCLQWTGCEGFIMVTIGCVVYVYVTYCPIYNVLFDVIMM